MFTGRLRGSPSSRRAWVEIRCLRVRSCVLPSPSSRRAWVEIRLYRLTQCRAMSPSSRRAWVEIVPFQFASLPFRVALLAEGVGRNGPESAIVLAHEVSPSSRRAWVEMGGNCKAPHHVVSPSSRRAWVEIGSNCAAAKRPRVALLAEGVGRNTVWVAVWPSFWGRPPRGGRG